MTKEHYLITRLQKLRPIFNAIFNRTATTKQALPVISTSVADIIRSARAIEVALGHLEEGYFDSQELSNEFAHLTQFAITLPVTIEGDGGFWGYALSLVNRSTLREGAEYCEVERIEDFINVLGEVLAIKTEIRQAREVLESKGPLDD